MNQPRDHSARPLAFAALAAVAGLVLGLLALLAFAPLASAHSGDLAWQRIYNGTGNASDAYFAAAPAPSGGVYATGSTSALSEGFLIARYSATGRLDWRRTWDDSAGGADAVAAAAAAPGGGLVVAGFASDPTEVVAVARYSAAGKRLWVRFHSETGADQQYAEKVAVDAAGNVYVLGTRFVSSYDILLLKYSAADKLRWVRRYASPGADWGTGIALDRSGDVYVSGYTPGANGNDALTLKYSPAGKRRWARVYDGPGGGNDAGLAVAVTADGTAYVAGSATGISSADDAVVLKYASNGALRWSRFQSGTGAFSDTYESIALAANGDVVATGDEFSPTTANDVFTARLSPGGRTRWMRLYNGPDNFADNGAIVAVAPTGAVFVEGFSDGAATNYDWLTLKYSAAGKFGWARRYSSSGSGLDFSNALIARARSVFVAGYQAATPDDDATLLKYKP